MANREKSSLESGASGIRDKEKGAAGNEANDRQERDHALEGAQVG